MVPVHHLTGRDPFLCPLEGPCCARIAQMRWLKVNPARVLFRRDLLRTPVPMDRDTHLHFLHILRDGADLHGLEAFTTDPIRFVHRGDVDWSDPDWVGDVPTEMNTGRSTTATPKDVQRRVETAASLWSKDPIADAANSTGTHQDPVAPAPPMDTRILAGASARTDYEVLELPAGSSMEDVYKAYHKLSAPHSPTRLKEPDQR